MLIPPQMRGMEIKDKQLVAGDFPVPQLQPDEVLIQVAYAGINHADLLQRNGRYPAPEGASPLPGMEVSGWVTAWGDAVTGFDIGDEVCALLGGGGYAEYVAVPASQVLMVPDDISLEEAACLPEAAATAIMALGDEANLTVGERMLIHGGTSGLGLIVTQIAKSWGAEVFTTVGSDAKVQFLAPFGFHVLNHRTQDLVAEIGKLTQGEGLDVIIDTLGAEQVQAHLGLLRRGGRMVSLAMMTGATVESLKIGRLLTHHLRWSGTTLRSRTKAQKAAIMAQVQARVWPAVAVGDIRPVVDRLFPLEDAEKALAYMQERLHLGKILLEVASK